MRTENNVQIPEGYTAILGQRDTQKAIKFLKDSFENELSKTLRLSRVTAPLFVSPDSGLNDNLNGVERPVGFEIDCMGERMEIVHSLAKWKRMALKQYGFNPGEGLYADMNAIRRDEVPDNLHSFYVDQWDWEKIITPQERSEETLKDIVRRIFSSVKSVEWLVCNRFPELKPSLPNDIAFIKSSEMLERYPGMTPKERENAAVREHGAIFVMQIGAPLADGKPHDGRAPDYDDWSLNGDLLFWDETLESAIEISSMGIRVDAEAMIRQLEAAGCPERASLPFHKALLDGELPLTVGGGIGQSRLCMLLLKKAHIGEVQVSAWPREMLDTCEKNGIHLL